MKVLKQLAIDNENLTKNILGFAFKHKNLVKKAANYAIKNKDINKHINQNNQNNKNGECVIY